MLKENKIKANKVLIKMLKQSIDPLRDTIAAAYLEEYAPGEGFAVNNYDPKSANLMEIYDMAACLLNEWENDSNYEDCERDFY